MLLNEVARFAGALGSPTINLPDSVNITAKPNCLAPSVLCGVSVCDSVTLFVPTEYTSTLPSDETVSCPTARYFVLSDFQMSNDVIGANAVPDTVAINVFADVLRLTEYK